MDIEISAQWDRMSMQEAAAQLGGKYNTDYGVASGEVGYLREPHHGEPYATRTLVPEAFRYGRARIAAADLQKRLPDALHIVETRERLTAFNVADETAIERMQKHYRDFVALCARKEVETGIPCLIVASSSLHSPDAKASGEPCSARASPRRSASRIIPRTFCRRGELFPARKCLAHSSDHPLSKYFIAVRPGMRRGKFYR